MLKGYMVKERLVTPVLDNANSTVFGVDIHTRKRFEYSLQWIEIEFMVNAD